MRFETVSEPSSTASQVYKTRQGEVLKVLGREPGPVIVGEDLEGYWYRLLNVLMCPM